MPYLKLLPWAGWPIALMFFFFWLGLKEDLAQQVELCNQQKLETVATAERLAREALSEAHQRELDERAALLQDETEARRLADMAREVAEDGAIAAQETIRRLMREAQTDETATIAQVCLGTDIDTAILGGLR